MKKLFLMLVLGLTMAVSVKAQTQERHVYNNMAITVGDTKDILEAGSVVFTNYLNTTTIKLYAPNGKVIFYDLVSPLELGKTENGSEFIFGEYLKRDTELRVGIQWFKDSRCGIRFISEKGDTVQFY